MKNENIIATTYLGLLAFSLYLSVVTGFPYFIYFLIIPPILIFVLLPLLLKLGLFFGLDKRKRKREQEKFLLAKAQRDKEIELEKKRRQDEREKYQKEQDEWKSNHDGWCKLHGLETLDEKNARKLNEERRLRDIKIKEENLLSQAKKKFKRHDLFLTATGKIKTPYSVYHPMVSEDEPNTIRDYSGGVLYYKDEEGTEHWATKVLYYQDENGRKVLAKVLPTFDGNKLMIEYKDENGKEVLIRVTSCSDDSERIIAYLDEDGKEVWSVKSYYKYVDGEQMRLEYSLSSPRLEYSPYPKARLGKQVNVNLVPKKDGDRVIAYLDENGNTIW